MNVKDDGRDKNKRNPLQSIDNRDCKRFHIKSIIEKNSYKQNENNINKTKLSFNNMLSFIECNKTDTIASERIGSKEALIKIKPQSNIFEENYFSSIIDLKEKAYDMEEFELSGEDVEKYFSTLIDSKEEAIQIENFRSKGPSITQNEIKKFVIRNRIKRSEIANMTGISTRSIGRFFSIAPDHPVNEKMKSDIYKWYLRYLKNKKIYRQKYFFTTENQKKENDKAIVKYFSKIKDAEEEETNIRELEQIIEQYLKNPIYNQVKNFTVDKKDKFDNDPSLTDISISNNKSLVSPLIEKKSFNNSDGKNQDELGIKINTLDYLEEEPEKIKKLNKIIADLKSVTKEHHNEKPYQLKVPVLNITEIRLLLNNFSSNCSQSQFIDTEIEQCDNSIYDKIIDGFEFECFDNKESLKKEFEKRKKFIKSIELQDNIIDKKEEENNRYCYNFDKII